MLTDLVLKNRSYRGYNKSRKVTKEELMELVDIARLCPSSANIQPLCYYLAWEPDEVARIQEQTRWAGAITHMKLLFNDHAASRHGTTCFYCDSAGYKD